MRFKFPSKLFQLYYIPTSYLVSYYYKKFISIYNIDQVQRKNRIAISKRQRTTNLTQEIQSKLHRSLLREIIDSLINDKGVSQLIWEQLCSCERATRRNQTLESQNLSQKRYNWNGQNALRVRSRHIVQDLFSVATSRNIYTHIIIGIKYWLYYHH